jgi:hypothetical protein
MRIQRWRAVEARLDGDAHLHVWAPNQDEDPFHLDLTNHIAYLIDRGRGQPEPPEPQWSDRGGTTIIVDFFAGSEGSIHLDGDEISGRAAIRLAAAGFHAFVDEVFGRSGGAAEPSAAAPDSDQGEAPDPGNEK